MTYTDKTIVITGAANGIGAVLARGYAEEGASVVLADTDAQNGENNAAGIRENNGKAQFIQTDVSREEEVINLMKKAEEQFGTIDLLINNAGKSVFRDPFDFSAADWDDVLGSNLKSVFLCTKEAAGYMKKHGMGGSVVNIASTRALMSEPHSEAYAASKGGIIGLTHAFAASLAEDRIRVNAVSPGWIHTGDREKLRDIDHEQHPSGRVGTPGDILRVCLFLTDPDNDFVNGENIVVDGGMTRKMIYEH
ncbi:3-ketoacyl-ACP reductase [Alteribacter lacisalsi]|uniref:3-ketoacyl-ACP reductase n=1 Tax=Alteribacter lacisalsi TaxID=2045244 RepID=A0A2W0H588_9BACI|nr:SDR family oxidoreductase [Alteribacter lacisalsi]PYZ95786.1 3-ketoacyl-ACP reductase [Alteribacter lacisalsi]